VCSFYRWLSFRRQKGFVRFVVVQKGISTAFNVQAQDRQQVARRYPEHASARIGNCDKCALGIAITTRAPLLARLKRSEQGGLLIFVFGKLRSAIRGYFGGGCAPKRTTTSSDRIVWPTDRTPYW